MSKRGPRKPAADGQRRGPRRAFFARWGGVPARRMHGSGEPFGKCDQLSGVSICLWQYSQSALIFEPSFAVWESS
jgi:hypothetical protein